MSPLFMCESDSPGSLSAEDCHSNSAGFEGEGEGQPTGLGGTKRREKNRDAARKSRKRQTEKADELHEELQGLERSNSALQREIASLKKELHFYETTLKRHESRCRLKTPPDGSDSFTHPSISDRRSTQTNAASGGIPPPSASSLSTSKSASQDCKTLNYKSISLPVPRTTSGASSVGPSSKLFAGCSGSVPYSVQLSTHVAPIASRSPGLLPNSAQLQPGQRNTLQTASAFISEPFLPTYHSSMNASPALVPPPPLLEVQNSRAVNQASAVNDPKLQSTSNPSGLNFPCSLYRSSPQNPAHEPFTDLLRSNPAPAFDQKMRHFHQVAPNAAPLLSQLTVPGPFTVSQTTNSFHTPPAPPLQSQPPPKDPEDLSLSHFLEINDWILTVPNNL